MKPPALPRSETARLDFERFNGEAIARFNSVDAFARGALRSLTVGNGGGILALFTFIGNAAAAHQFDATRIWWAFAAFVVGLIAVFAGTICGYFSQSYFMQFCMEQAVNAQDVLRDEEKTYPDDATNRAGERWERGGIAGVVVSLVAFAIGSGFALAGVLPG